MAGFAFERSRLIKNYWISVNHLYERVTFITRNSRMTALQRNLCLLVVVKA